MSIPQNYRDLMPQSLNRVISSTHYDTCYSFIGIYLRVPVKMVIFFREHGTIASRTAVYIAYMKINRAGSPVQC